jgi:NTP pyrophosphatase (non-canonical NTP hydrolase)
MEELGELARAMRKTHNGVMLAADENPALELADVTLYALHLANVLSVDLAAAVAEKEKINALRFESRTQRAAA